MIAMSAIKGMIKPPRSSLPCTFSPAGATSVVALEVTAEVCATAVVDAAINATEAVAAKIPLKPTSASPFVLESDLLDFRPLTSRGDGACLPRNGEGRNPQLHPVRRVGLRELKANAAARQRVQRLLKGAADCCTKATG